jgi:hypothetical protein
VSEPWPEGFLPRPVHRKEHKRKERPEGINVASDSGGAAAGWKDGRRNNMISISKKAQEKLGEAIGPKREHLLRVFVKGIG